MTCSSCKYLKEGDRKEGSACGTCYYCSKLKKHVNGSNSKCNEFDKAYARKTYICDKIYKEGLNYCDDSTPISLYILLLIIMSTIALISNFILGIN